MFLKFFLLLRQQQLPVTLKEYLTFLEALDKGVGRLSVEDFYAVARTTLIKHEAQLDRFDQCFGHYFRGMELIEDEDLVSNIPEEWLRRELERVLSPEEIEQLEAMGGLEALQERFRELLKEQRERHQGGNKWIGTGGTSPFGAYGYNPEGYRIGQQGNRNRRAVKVWDKRRFRNLRDDRELNTRNLQMALRHLRDFTREGLPEELDLEETIRKTSKNAGMLELEMVPRKRNNVKLLLLMDVGGSMDDHIRRCEELFSAARYQFKNLEYFYFHNCVYEGLWRDNRRRHREAFGTFELLRTYNSDYKLIYVGDAAMSPYELAYPGGSVEHWNEEAGFTWLQRLNEHFSSYIWLNPNPREYWPYYESTHMLHQFMEGRMFPLTPAGLKNGMEALKNPKLQFPHKLGAG